jgi:hypothetical protein
MDPDKLRKICEALIKGTQTSLNKIDRAQFTPEQVKELEGLEARLNQMLKDLPPIDQVPAAQDASWAIRTLERMFENLNDMQKAMADTITSIESRVKTQAEAAVNSRIQSGELLTKEKHKELVDLARKEGENSGAAAARLQGERREKVLKAGLLMPSDDVIAAADFDKLLTAAEAHGAELTKAGVKLQGAFGGSVWATEAAQKLALEQIAETAGGKGGNTRLQGDGRPPADPKIGGGKPPATGKWADIPAC